jgi:hypothetical protein
MNNFDFFIGNWTVANRRLVKALSGSDEWEEFPATITCQGFFEGAGSFEEIIFPTKGWRGATVRTFDPATELWSLYWVNSRIGRIDPPVVGRFVDGVGDFQGDDVWEGQPIRVRFLWTDITAHSAHWQQAFSTDGGETWETNWHMQHTRTV